MQVQEQQKQPSKKFIQDVETRWNSTYYMMERYLEQHDHVTYTLCYLRKTNVCLSNEELVLLQYTINVLEPFEEATKEMSAEKVTSISKIIPMVRGIQGYMNSILSTGPQPINNQHSLARELKRQMEQRFFAMEGSFTLKAATLLDPSFKNREFVTLFSKLKEMANRYLCTLASSVPSERLFSKAGELISHRRSSLKGENINMILFLNKNI
ncbi:zinc finger BED domain-containing protein 4-like [Scylla paramamosain]|uniref:zinc finger BED domain-containing protein 4-like n=1 Tax=Scylla paramamosain TaxID=85552 RepID=UPI003082B7C8